MTLAYGFAIWVHVSIVHIIQFEQIDEITYVTITSLCRIRLFPFDLVEDMLSLQLGMHEIKQRFKGQWDVANGT